jgi:capsule polysaccharide export protein KpsE/RkpR
MAVISLDLTTLIVALLSGGFVTGVVALLRFRVDKDAVVVTAAQGAVVVQTGVIDALQEELKRVKTELDESRAEVTRQISRYESLRIEKLALEAKLQSLGIGRGTPK